MQYKDIKSKELSIDGIRIVSRGVSANRGKSIQSILKIASVACLSLVLSIGVLSTGSTMSYFIDTESSLGNFFKAVPLYFTVSASSTDVTLDDSEQMIVAFMTPGAESVPIQYRVSAQMTGGNSALCDAIVLFSTAPFIYDGPLLGLATATSSEVGPWALNFYLPSSENIPANASCTVDLVYQGWDIRAAIGEGYSDTEHLSITFLMSPSLSILDEVTEISGLSDEVENLDSTETAPRVEEDSTGEGVSEDTLTPEPEERSTRSNPREEVPEHPVRPATDSASGQTPVSDEATAQ